VLLQACLSVLWVSAPSPCGLLCAGVLHCLCFVDPVCVPCLGLCAPHCYCCSSADLLHCLCQEGGPVLWSDRFGVASLHSRSGQRSKVFLHAMPPAEPYCPLCPLFVYDKMQCIPTCPCFVLFCRSRIVHNCASRLLHGALSCSLTLEPSSVTNTLLLLISPCVRSSAQVCWKCGAQCSAVQEGSTCVVLCRIVMFEIVRHLRHLCCELLMLQVFVLDCRSVCVGARAIVSLRVRSPLTS
jgi:hypothetical protein